MKMALHHVTNRYQKSPLQFYECYLFFSLFSYNFFDFAFYQPGVFLCFPVQKELVHYN